MIKNKIAINIFKVVLLFAILILSYIICMILFLSTFGTGGQATMAVKNGYGILIASIPLIVTLIAGYKIFGKKKTVN